MCLVSTEQEYMSSLSHTFFFYVNQNNIQTLFFIFYLQMNIFAFHAFMKIINFVVEFNFLKISNFNGVQLSVLKYAK